MFLIIRDLPSIFDSAFVLAQNFVTFGYDPAQFWRTQAATANQLSGCICSKVTTCRENEFETANWRLVRRKSRRIYTAETNWCED